MDVDWLQAQVAGTQGSIAHGQVWAFVKGERGRLRGVECLGEKQPQQDDNG